MAGIARSHTGYRKKLLRSQSAPKGLFGTVPASGANVSLRRGAKERAEMVFMIKEVLLSPVGFAIGFAALIGARIAGFKLFSAEGMYPEMLSSAKMAPMVDIGMGVVLAIVLMIILRMNSGFRRIAVLVGFAAAFWFEPVLMNKYQAEYDHLYPYKSLRAAIL